MHRSTPGPLHIYCDFQVSVFAGFQVGLFLVPYLRLFFFYLFASVQFQCVSFIVVYYIIIPTETCFLLRDRKGIDLDKRGSGGRIGRSRGKETIIRI